jgi:hypothetical protein
VISRGIAVTCKAPECETSWAVRIYRGEGTSECEHCGALHEYEEPNGYWLVEDDEEEA